MTNSGRGKILLLRATQSNNPILPTDPELLSQITCYLFDMRLLAQTVGTSKMFALHRKYFEAWLDIFVWWSSITKLIFERLQRSSATSRDEIVMNIFLYERYTGWFKESPMTLPILSKKIISLKNTSTLTT